MIVAAIDIGSNAVRLYIVSLSNSYESGYKTLEYVRVPVRLGDYVFINNFIPEKKEQDLVDLMRSFKILMDLFRVEAYRACATSALREAKNGPKIVQRIKGEVQVNIEIISGEEEAQLIFTAHNNLINQYSKALFVDVGGGSTEITFFQNNQISNSKSFKLGTVRILDNKDDEKVWEELFDWLKHAVKTNKPDIVIATGGNISKAFSLMQVKNGKPTPFKKLKHLYDTLNGLSYRERISHLGLNPDRADVIIPALEIYISTMKASNCNTILTSGLGLRDGMIRQLFLANEQNLPKTPAHKKTFSFY